MVSTEQKTEFLENPAVFLEREIKEFVCNSPLNRMPFDAEYLIWDEPLVKFADGDDALFTEYKKIIAPAHLTPREALAKAYGKLPEEMPSRLSVISWILPTASKTRQSNRQHSRTPSRLWAQTRWYGEKLNDALRRHVTDLLKELGYQATAPALQPYFKQFANEKGRYSNWSERHVAYVAGQGTFSLSDGFITERGIAHRCGSVVTDLELPPSPRTASGPYSNCLFYVDGSCRACIARCPVGAITEKGHDKLRCDKYQFQEMSYLLKEYDVGVAGCGLCQVKIPCEFRNPTRKLKR